MISYELALALEKAGFPQPKDLSYYEYRFIRFYQEDDGDVTELNNMELRVDAWDDDWVYIPTIEDLLRELPKSIPDPDHQHVDYPCRIMLFCERDSWYAGFSPFEDILKVEGTGETPEEALANLWLALHP